MSDFLDFTEKYGQGLMAVTTFFLAIGAVAGSARTARATLRSVDRSARHQRELAAAAAVTEAEGEQQRWNRELRLRAYQSLASKAHAVVTTLSDVADIRFWLNRPLENDTGSRQVRNAWQAKWVKVRKDALQADRLKERALADFRGEAAMFAFFASATAVRAVRTFVDNTVNPATIKISRVGRPAANATGRDVPAEFRRQLHRAWRELVNSFQQELGLGAVAFDEPEL